MNKSILIMIKVIFFCTIVICKIDAQEIITIYKNASESGYGYSHNRDMRITITTESNNTDKSTVFTVPITTCVVIDKKVKETLEVYARNRTPLSRSGSSLEIINTHDIEALNYRDNSGVDIVFSFIKPDKKIFDLIGKIYINDKITAKKVSDHYRSNFIIKIHKGLNILKPQTVNPAFESAMYSATLIGDKYQWLWGIHDGRGYLSDIKPISLEDKMITEVIPENPVQHIYQGYYNYRNYEKNEAVLYQFIKDIDKPGVAFAEELYRKISSLFYIVPDVSRKRCYIPEEIIEEKFGDNRDFTLFYYDLLKRKHYEVKLVYLFDAPQGNLIKTLTLFKEKDGKLWGAVDESGFLPYENEDFTTIPAKFLRKNTYFIEIDANEVLKRRFMLYGFTEPYIQSIYQEAE